MSGALHGRDRHEERQVLARPSRLHLSRRDRDDERRTAGQAAARPAGARNRAARRGTDASTWTFASSRRPTATSVSSSTRAGSRTICSIACTSIPIVVPPLRERAEDIPMLVEHFVDKHATRSGKSIEALEEGVDRVAAGVSLAGQRARARERHRARRRVDDRLARSRATRSRSRRRRARRRVPCRF